MVSSSSSLTLRRIGSSLLISAASVSGILIIFTDSSIFNLVWKALLLSPSRIGGNWATVVYEIVLVILYQISRLRRYGWKLVMAAWRRKLLDSVLVAVAGACLLFCFSLFVSVKDVWRSAEKIPAPDRPAPPRMPVQWASFRAPKPGTSKVILIFKESPAFTAAKRNHIQKTIDEVYDYLKKLGFDIPVECPPIGVDSSGIFRSSGIFPGSIYDSNFMLPEQRLDDEELIRWAYAQQVFNVLFYQNPDWSEGMGQFAAQTFARYYASTISGTKFGATDSLLNKLWAVRQKEGKSFTDRAMFYTYKRWYERRPNAEEKADFDAFFVSRFTGGANVVANGFEQYKEILSILK